MTRLAAQLFLTGTVLALSSLIGCSFDQSALESRTCDPAAEEPGCDAGFECGGDGYCYPADVSSEDADEIPGECGAQICTVGQQCCEEACVDVTRDAAHCGACGAACAEGMTCRDSACVCSSERGDCDADPSNGCEVQLTGFDADHCGACGNACPANMACVAGTCLCQPGRVDCNEDRDQLPTGGSDGCEVDILSNASCGGCGDDRRCEDSESCEQGRCRCGEEGSVCVAGEACCAGNCTNTATSQAHCGGCDQKCDPGLVCVEGDCVCQAAGNVACGEGQVCCSDGCVDGDSCPSCGTVDCTDTQLCCGDECKNTLTDPVHCGGCNIECGPGQSCVGGSCVCDSGGEFCPTAGDDGMGGCVDTGIEEAFCGDCDTACAAGETCCDGACVDTNANSQQCGACIADGGQTCAMGQACCNGACRGLGNTSNCGACGNDCGGLPHVDQVGCMGGGCVIEACDAEWADCDGNPANGCEAHLRYDQNNCGSCGVVCNTTCDEWTCSCSTGEDCAFGADCDANGECRCAGGTGEKCEWYRDGASCNGSSCRCFDDGRCDGILHCSTFWEACVF